MSAHHDAATEPIGSGGDSARDGDASPGGDDAATEAPMNRAERRAKGKATQQPRLSVSRIDPRQSRGAAARRRYANRRSGGGG